VTVADTCPERAVLLVAPATCGKTRHVQRMAVRHDAVRMIEDYQIGELDGV
jgi:MoxR-like ATPase